MTFQACYSLDTHSEVNALGSRLSTVKLDPVSTKNTSDLSAKNGSAPRALLTALALSSTVPKKQLTEDEKTLAIKIHSLLLSSADGQLLHALSIKRNLADSHNQGLEIATVNRVLYAYEDVHFVKHNVEGVSKPFWKAL